MKRNYTPLALYLYRLGITRQQLMDASGISRCTLSRLCRGLGIHADSLAAVARALSSLTGREIIPGTLVDLSHGNITPADADTLARGVDGP